MRRIFSTKSRGACTLAISAVIAMGAVPLAQADAKAPERHSQPKQALSKVVLGVECSRIKELGIDKQVNMRAAAIRVGCGLEPGGRKGPRSSHPPAVPALPGNIDVVTGGETYPAVTQSESMVASKDGQTIVVNYNDSRDAGSAAPKRPEEEVAGYSGASISTDGGATFTRFDPSPFSDGHGTNFGDPIVVYNQKLGMWFAGDLATGCGGQGIGLWTSVDGSTWAAGACAHNGSQDDRESMWVDNTPTSPYYGRMYISWNDFNVGGGALYVTHSDDGVNWSSVAVNTAFIRDVQITGGPDGTVFVAAMDEGGGGLNSRHNYMYRSIDGGAVFGSGISMGSSFSPPGDALCTSNSYFAQVNPIWRHMGWGQPAVGPGGIVHYAYAGHGLNGTDTGDIFYVRSIDNGLTWSTPIVLNTDQAVGGTKTQWMPSVTVTPLGQIHVYWYDRRDTTDGQNYKVYGRQSRDNGNTWLYDEPVSSVLIPQPEQPDPLVNSCYAGDYNYATSFGNIHYATWTDGRVAISGHQQQDVMFAAVAAQAPLCCKDFNKEGHADILWRYTDGSLVQWQMNGFTPTLKAGSGSAATRWAVVGLGDFDGDGYTDILWRDNTGALSIWLMQGTTILNKGTRGVQANGPPGPAWQVAAVGDFDGDGKADILWHDVSGNVLVWLMDKFTIKATGLKKLINPDWQVAGVGDFNKDNKADIIWRNKSGASSIWLLDGTNLITSGNPGNVPPVWQIAGIGDFDADGRADILWRRATDGALSVWLISGTSRVGFGTPGPNNHTSPTQWQVVGVGDFNKDARADILWRNNAGGLDEWQMNQYAVTHGSPGSPPLAYQVE